MTFKVFLTSAVAVPVNYGRRGSADSAARADLNQLETIIAPEDRREGTDDLLSGERGTDAHMATHAKSQMTPRFGSL